MKAESAEKIKRIQKEARERILERGKIEFRVEPELLTEILDLAKKRKQPVGPMIRQWVKERLELESKSSKTETQLDVIERKIDSLLVQNKRKQPG